MAAGITEYDQMISVRETPWHGLGIILDQQATALEIHNLCFPWRVHKQEAYTKSGLRLLDTFATVREDTNTVLGVVGPRYEIFQNWDACEFFDLVTRDPNGPKYETAGSLHGGRRIWIMAKLPSFIEVTRDDIVDEYLLLANGHDGSIAVHMLWTPVRVVCQNTLSMGLARGKGARFTVRHTKSMKERVEQARQILGLATDNHNDFANLVPDLVSYKPTSDEVNTVLDRLFKASDLDSVKDKAKLQNLGYEKDVIISSWKIDETNNLPGIEGSAWSLYNSITEHVDYFRESRRGQDADSRLDSNWFGEGANLKARALDLVTSMAGR